MNQITKRLTGIILTAIVAIVIPAISFAANLTKDEVQIVQINEGKCMIYIKGLENTEFNYALSLNSSTPEMELKYIHSVKDGEGNQVALVESADFDFEKNTKAFLNVKRGTELDEIEIDFEKAFSKEKIEEIESTTKRIKTEIVDGLTEEDRIDANGVHVTLKTGGIKINDDQDAKYFYETSAIEGNYEKIMNLAEKINSEYSNMDMFSKIQTLEEFNEIYSTLVNEADWKQVNDMTIKQPKEATENSKYVVLLKKEDGSNVITDVQFLTSQEEKEESYEREKIVTQETTKLPITGDNIILILAFIVVIIALILVFIKMKSNKEKESK